MPFNPYEAFEDLTPEEAASLDERLSHPTNFPVRTPQPIPTMTAARFAESFSYLVDMGEKGEP